MAIQTDVRPTRPFAIERRSLAPDRPRLRPKPDAATELRDVASAMTHLPRDCFRDGAELVTLMRRLAGRVLAVADAGLDVAPSHAVRAARQPFMPRPRVDAREVAAAVFGAGRVRGQQPTTITSRNGNQVKVEVRRRMLVAAGQIEMGV